MCMLNCQIWVDLRIWADPTNGYASLSIYKKKKKKDWLERFSRVLEWSLVSLSATSMYRFKGCPIHPPQPLFLSLYETILVSRQGDQTKKRSSFYQFKCIIPYITVQSREYSPKLLLMRITLNENHQYVLMKQYVKSSKCWSHEIFGSCVRKTKVAKRKNQNKLRLYQKSWKPW